MCFWHCFWVIGSVFWIGFVKLFGSMWDFCGIICYFQVVFLLCMGFSGVLFFGGLCFLVAGLGFFFLLIFCIVFSFGSFVLVFWGLLVWVFSGGLFVIEL